MISGVPQGNNTHAFINCLDDCMKHHTETSRQEQQGRSSMQRELVRLETGAGRSLIPKQGWWEAIRRVRELQFLAYERQREVGLLSLTEQEAEGWCSCCL